MKNWQETYRIMRRLKEARQTGRRAALVTIVDIAGSTYRRVGAKLLVEEGGPVEGHISGGCLEDDVRQAALDAIRDNAPRLAHYDTSDAEDVVWGLGLGCNGQVDLWIEPMDPAAPSRVETVLEQMDGTRAFSVSVQLPGGDGGAGWMVSRSAAVVASTFEPALSAIVHTKAGELLAAGASAQWNRGETRIFTEVLTPPPRLVVCGAGDDARPLVALAAEIGFRVVVVDHRAAYLEPGRFPGAEQWVKARSEDPLPAGLGTGDEFVIVKTHTARHDRQWIRHFAQSGFRYLGLLGPRARREEILSALTPEERGRVHAPVGLDLGADGAEQVALSVVAEALAVYAGRPGGPLKDRTGPIH
jgi:xanthine dehydrogenase accessory factor